MFITHVINLVNECHLLKANARMNEREEQKKPTTTTSRTEVHKRITVDRINIVLGMVRIKAMKSRIHI